MYSGTLTQTHSFTYQIHSSRTTVSIQQYEDARYRQRVSHMRAHRHRHRQTERARHTHTHTQTHHVYEIWQADRYTRTYMLVYAQRFSQSQDRGLVRAHTCYCIHATYDVMKAHLYKLVYDQHTYIRLVYDQQKTLHAGLSSITCVLHVFHIQILQADLSGGTQVSSSVPKTFNSTCIFNRALVLKIKKK